MKKLRLLALAATLLLLGRAAAQADILYKIQSIVKAGDQVGIARIDPDEGLYVSPLNDSGQLVFVPHNSAGGGEALIQYDAGKQTLTPIVAAGGDSPEGKWPEHVLVMYHPYNMNQQGDVVVVTGRFVDGKVVPGATYLWDYETRQMQTVIRPGMPIDNNLTVERSGGTATAINNRGEMAVTAVVKNAAGQERTALFFRGQDGQLQPVALPGQVLPDGRTVREVWGAAINDAGVMLFREAGPDQVLPADGAIYLWEKGIITPVVTDGQAGPDGGKIAVRGHLLNNRDRTALIAATLDHQPGQFGLYRFTEGKLVPLIVPGQDMPEGGKLQTVRTWNGIAVFNISTANAAGQHAFVAQLQDGSTAAYRLDPDGTLTLILKSGATTDLGTIAEIGGLWFGVGLNTKGQVALPVRIAGETGHRVVLLTPVGP
jgi:hypothetical protein